MQCSGHDHNPRDSAPVLPPLPVLGVALASLESSAQLQVSGLELPQRRGVQDRRVGVWV